MTDVLSFAERKLRSAIEDYFGDFARAGDPVSVRAALEAVHQRIGETGFSDERIIHAIEAYGVHRGHVLRLDGHAAR